MLCVLRACLHGPGYSVYNCPAPQPQAHVFPFARLHIKCVLPFAWLHIKDDGIPLQGHAAKARAHVSFSLGGLVLKVSPARPHTKVRGMVLTWPGSSPQLTSHEAPCHRPCLHRGPFTWVTTLQRPCSHGAVRMG